MAGKCYSKMARLARLSPNGAVAMLMSGGSEMNLRIARYVSNLKHNYILFGTFDAKSYRIKVENAVLKVTRGPLWY